MNKLIIVIYMLLCAGCKQQQNADLLQTLDVALVKPRVTTSNHIIDSSVVVEAELRMDGVKIYMTSNGSDPTEASELYSEPLYISEPGTFKFKAFHPAWNASETETIRLIKKGQLVSDMLWITHANSKYKGKGENTLANHKKARVDYRDSEWVGFDTIASAITRFKKQTFINTLDIGYLNNPGAWIFPPEQIRVLVSVDGVDYKVKETLNLKPLMQAVDQRVETKRLLINESVKAIKIEVKNVTEIPAWHEGAGHSAWLFMDEWVFN